MNTVYLRFIKISTFLTIFIFATFSFTGLNGSTSPKYTSKMLEANDTTSFTLISYALADSGFSLGKIIPYDLNKDGFKDLVFMTRRDIPSLTKIMFLPGQEEGFDLSNMTAIVEDPDIYSLFLGDWDGDMNADLITGIVRHLPGNSATTDILKVWFLSDITIIDTIRFQVPEEIYLGSPLGPLSLENLADFDLDGKSDLVLGGFGEITIGWNDGSNIPVYQKITDKGANTYTVVVLDYNQDGYPDFLNDDQYATEPVIHENQKNRSFLRKTVGLPKVAWDAKEGHYWNFRTLWFNQDSYPDIFTQRSDTSRYSYYELYEYQETSASYVKSELQIDKNNVTVKIIPIHFNNDGYIDFVEVSKGLFRIWINKNNNSFDTEECDFGMRYVIQNMFNMDYDNDNDLDIFFSFYSGDTLYLIINSENITNVAPTIPTIDSIYTGENEISIEWNESQDDYSLTGHINYSLWLQSENISLNSEIHKNEIRIKNLPAGNYSLSIAASDPIGLTSDYSDVFPFTITSTGVSDKDFNLSSFQLFQNYPNPFNPITIIKYELPKESKVVLSVFDMNGRLVETLVNETQPVGHYSVQWNATKHSSGVYIYKIQAGGFSAFNKCLLIK